MLQEQIKHIDKVVKLYKLRHVPNIGMGELSVRLGHERNSNGFHRMMTRLKKDGVLDEHGVFVENLSNRHLAMMPLSVPKDQINVLGQRPPYIIFLTIMFGRQWSAKRMSSEYTFTEGVARSSMKALKTAGLIYFKNGTPVIREDSAAYKWFVDHLTIVRLCVDDEDMMHLFKTIPLSWIGGPAFDIMQKWVSGTPAGTLPLYILTPKAFVPYMQSLVDKSPYFQNMDRRVLVKVNEKQAKLRHTR